MKEFLIIVGLIFLLIGVIAIYDARPLSRYKIFKGEQNKIAKGIKIVGFALTMVGLILLYNFLNI